MNAILLTTTAAALVAAGSPVWIGKFSGSGALPAPWRVVQIDKKTKPTTYRLSTVAGVAAVEARANDLDGLREGRLRSWYISRLDLIVRWGGGRRLSGFLPVQSVYADICVRDELWPDYQPHHLDEALAWFKEQDRTLGG